MRVPAFASVGEWGEACNDVEVWFHESRLEGLSMEIRAFKNDYLIATCASTKDVILEPFEILNHHELYPAIQV